MKLIKNKKARIILFSVLALILVIGGSVAGYGYYQLNKVKVVEISKSDEDLGITNNTSTETEPTVEMDDDIVNIALFGIDRRKSNEACRSDTIVIATIDKKHKKIKVSSVMRDTYVKIEGHGMDKITHAYFYGGPQLAIKTLNQNFNLNIRDFVTVDFFSLAKMIDTLGGVTIDVKQTEIKNINDCIKGMAALNKSTPTYIKKSGTQLLNGIQAVAYGRIRYVGNGDYERTDRQRKVLNVLFEKIENAGAIKYPYIVSQLLPYTETSLDKATILKLGTQVLVGNINVFEQQRFPLTAASEDTKINGIYYLWADLNATAKHINEFIYDDETPKVAAGDVIQRAPKTETKTAKTSTVTTTKKTTTKSSTSKSSTSNVKTSNSASTGSSKEAGTTGNKAANSNSNDKDEASSPSSSSGNSSSGSTDSKNTGSEGSSSGTTTGTETGGTQTGGTETGNTQTGGTQEQPPVEGGTETAQSN